MDLFSYESNIIGMYVRLAELWKCIRPYSEACNELFVKFLVN